MRPVLRMLAYCSSGVRLMRPCFVTMVTKPPSVSASLLWQIMLVTFSPSASCSRLTMLLPLLVRLPSEMV